MFAIVLPGEEIDARYNKYIFIGGILLALIISAIRGYNAIKKAKAKIPKLKADIESVKKMQSNLLDKANRVSDKYLSHESDIMTNVANARKTEPINRVRNATEFKTVIENYPDLKANNAIMRLLEQLEVTEGRLLKTKTDYTESVAYYNTKIHSFPFSIFRGLFRMEDIQIELEDVEEIVSDEELGI